MFVRQVAVVVEVHAIAKCRNIEKICVSRVNITFMKIVERQGLFVWFQHRRNITQIKKYGHVIYVSRKMRYALVYVNRDEVDEKETQLKNLPFISKTERSYKPYIKTSFENALPDQAKMYDYKIDT